MFNFRLTSGLATTIPDFDVFTAGAVLQFMNNQRRLLRELIRLRFGFGFSHAYTSRSFTESHAWSTKFQSLQLIPPKCYSVIVIFWRHKIRTERVRVKVFMIEMLQLCRWRADIN